MNDSGFRRKIGPVELCKGLYHRQPFVVPVPRPNESEHLFALYMVYYLGGIYRLRNYCIAYATPISRNKCSSAMYGGTPVLPRHVSVFFFFFFSYRGYLTTCVDGALREDLIIVPPTDVSVSMRLNVQRHP